MNRPPQTTHAATTPAPAREQQKSVLRRKWLALQEACQAKHLEGHAGGTKVRRCACGKSMGHGDACEMLAIIRSFFTTCDMDNPKSWERTLVDLLSEVIP